MLDRAVLYSAGAELQLMVHVTKGKHCAPSDVQRNHELNPKHDCPTDCAPRRSSERSILSAVSRRSCSIVRFPDIIVAVVAVVVAVAVAVAVAAVAVARSGNRRVVVAAVAAAG